MVGNAINSHTRTPYIHTLLLHLLRLKRIVYVQFNDQACLLCLSVCVLFYFFLEILEKMLHYLLFMVWWWIIILFYLFSFVVSFLFVNSHCTNCALLLCLHHVIYEDDDADNNWALLRNTHNGFALTIKRVVIGNKSMKTF